ncbi:conserved hypothetical protein [Ricinus communis]|uniref:Uncharacterized protein n=1 Tax=Ricinus communis TaxID=3988 RepID=B9SD89_RICCO|nr:conserved hypothetical protein [Ricinus communis]
MPWWLEKTHQEVIFKFCPSVVFLTETKQIQQYMEELRNKLGFWVLFMWTQKKDQGVSMVCPKRGEIRGVGFNYGVKDK